MFWFVREPFGTFSEDREVGKSVRGRAGANWGIFRKFYPKQACTGPWVLRGPVSFKSERFFSACTGLQVSRRPVSFQSESTLQGGYRSTGFAWTGPCCFSEGFLGGYRSSCFAWTGPSKVRNMVWGRVPVYRKGGDRSLSSQRLELQEGTGLRKRRRPVPLPVFGKFIKGVMGNHH